MKNFKLITMAMALTATCAACTDNETVASGTTTDGRTALNINAGIASRAIDNAWQKNDAIGIVMFQKGTDTPTNEGTNFKYTTPEGNGAFAPADKANTAWYPTDNSEVDIIAYYPYNSTVTANSLVIPIDVTSQNNLPAIDLLTAAKAEGHSTQKPGVTLEFAHRMSKLVINVKKDINGTADDVDLNGAKAVLQGTAPTASYELLTGKFTKPGAVKDINLPMVYDAAQKQLNSTAIVLPTGANAGLKIILTLADNRKFIVPFKEGDALKSGEINLLNITLHRTEASLQATVIPWATGLEGAMTININTVKAEGTVDGAGSFVPSAGDILRLGSSELELKNVDYTYNASTQKWTAAAAPYWDYSKEGPFTFRALVLPQTATGDNVRDYLYGTVSNINFGDNLDFELNHIMSRLTVKVMPGTGYVMSDLSAVTLKWTAVTELNEVTLGADNYVVTLKSTTKDIAMNKGTATEAYIPYSAIAAPQSLSAQAQKIILTIGERNYTLNFAKLLDTTNKPTGITKLEAGRSYTITATLNKNNADLSLTVSDWTEADAGEGGFDYNK